MLAVFNHYYKLNVICLQISFLPTDKKRNFALNFWYAVLGKYDRRKNINLINCIFLMKISSAAMKYPSYFFLVPNLKLPCRKILLVARLTQGISSSNSYYEFHHSRPDDLNLITYVDGFSWPPLMKVWTIK